MLKNLTKTIGFISLGIASLCLVGCFHIPDEDWLPSKDKVDTGNVEKENEMEQAINSFMDGIGIISSEWNEMKNNEEKEVENDVEIDESENILDIDLEDEVIENSESSLEEMIDSLE